MSNTPCVSEDGQSAVTGSILGKGGDEVPLSWDATDELRFQRELNTLKAKELTKEQLLNECAALRVQLKKKVSCMESFQSWLGQPPASAYDKVLLVTQVHKAAVRGSELAEDLSKFAQKVYENWQEFCETTVDD